MAMRNVSGITKAKIVRRQGAASRNGERFPLRTLSPPVDPIGNQSHLPCAVQEVAASGETLNALSLRPSRREEESFLTENHINFTHPDALIQAVAVADRRACKPRTSFSMGAPGVTC